MSEDGGHESDEDFCFLEFIDDEDDGYPSKLYELVIKWQLPVFDDVTDDVDEQRQKLRETLRIARTPSDHSLPKRNFVAISRKSKLGIAEIFPPKEVVVQKMRDLLCDLLSPKCQKPHDKCYRVGDFILTRKAMRVWKVMETCYHFLMEYMTFTEEEVYEVLSHFPRYFPKQSYVSKAINALEKLMQCSRYSFGIKAAKVGMVAGPLSIVVNPRKSPLRGYSGFDLPKELQVLQSMEIILNISYIHCIIVVQEKEKFEALVNCPMFKNVPIILMTADGIPEFTTRFFLHRLRTENPEIPIYGLVDWSPAGLEVLCAYKYGNTGSRFERNKLACVDMDWLGATYKDIAELQKTFENRVLLERDLLEPLTVEDMEIVTRLGSFYGELHDDYKKELDIMVEKNSKASSGSVRACYVIRGDNLGAYVLSKAYSISSNIRWFSKGAEIRRKHAKKLYHF